MLTQGKMSNYCSMISSQDGIIHHRAEIGRISDSDGYAAPPRVLERSGIGSVSFRRGTKQAQLHRMNHDPLPAIQPSMKSTRESIQFHSWDVGLHHQVLMRYTHPLRRFSHCLFIELREYGFYSRTRGPQVASGMLNATCIPLFRVVPPIQWS